MATGAEPLPAQDTAVDGMAFVEKIEQGAYRVLNNTGVTIDQYDYVLIHGLLGVAYQEAVDGAYFNLLVDDEIEIHADDLVTGALTFGTIYQTVYFNQAVGKFADTVGYGVPVGILSEVKDSGGVIKFFNLRKTMPLAGEVSTVEFEIVADATGGIEFPLGYNFKLLDVIVYPTITNAAATLTLSDGTNAISDAMAIAVTDTRVVPVTLDKTYNTISGTDILTLTTNGAADRCRLLLTIKAV